MQNYIKKRKYPQEIRNILKSPYTGIPHSPMELTAASSDKRYRSITGLPEFGYVHNLAPVDIHFPGDQPGADPDIPFHLKFGLALAR